MSDEVIDKAIDVLHEHGWTQGSLHDEFGYCIDGALQIAAVNILDGDHPITNHQVHGMSVALAMARDKVETTINRRMRAWCTDPEHHECYWEIPEWNDDYCNDADEAIEVLKLASDLDYSNE